MYCWISDSSEMDLSVATFYVWFLNGALCQLQRSALIESYYPYKTPDGEHLTST